MCAKASKSRVHVVSHLAVVLFCSVRLECLQTRQLSFELGQYHLLMVTKHQPFLEMSSSCANTHTGYPNTGKLLIYPTVMDHTYSFTCTAMNEKNISLGVGPPLMERSYWSISNGGVLMAHTECEGWLSPGGHSLGGRALTAQVSGPQFNPRWLPVFHGTHVHTQT